MVIWYKLYAPEGIRTKENLCNCGHCDRYRELYHAVPYVFTKDVHRLKQKMKEHPDGIPYEIVYANDQFTGGEVSHKRIEEVK